MDTSDLDTFEVEEQEIALRERALMIEWDKLELQSQKLRLLRQRKGYGMLTMIANAAYTFFCVLDDAALSR